MCVTRREAQKDGREDRLVEKSEKEKRTWGRVEVRENK